MGLLKREHGYIETYTVRMGVFALANYYLTPKLCFTKSILSLVTTNPFVNHLKKMYTKRRAFWFRTQPHKILPPGARSSARAKGV